MKQPETICMIHRFGRLQLTDYYKFSVRLLNLGDHLTLVQPPSIKITCDSYKNLNYGPLRAEILAGLKTANFTKFIFTMDRFKRL